jgi:nucleoid-associated protein YgaU
MNTLRRIGFLAAAASLLVVAGCGSKVTRTVDVSNGEYYDAEEFAKLSKEQRDAYCAQLDQELARLDSEASAANNKASSVSSELSGVQSDVRNLQNRYDQAKGDVDEVQEQIDYFEGLPKQHTVVDGEFLYKISGYEKIYADPLKWPRIYRANKDRINDPNLIYPGWVLSIPRDWPKSWVVKQDEYLAKIAGYWEVYDDRSAWPRLHEANQDKISDPDIIWPGWELTIPRN